MRMTSTIVDVPAGAPGADQEIVVSRPPFEPVPGFRAQLSTVGAAGAAGVVTGGVVGVGAGVVGPGTVGDGVGSGVAGGVTAGAVGLPAVTVMAAVPC